MSVVVGVPTFKRPESLRRTLESLAQQGGSEALLILVVDNDPAGSAAHVPSEVSGLRIEYHTEPHPGVVFVRNRLLREASTASCLIFIDDDETVTPGWLAAMLAMHDRHPNDVLTGPVDYVVDGSPPTDPLLATIFRRPDRDHGETLPLTGTGNSLVPLSSLSLMHAPAFDERFSVCGGEDIDFFGRFASAGGTIRWCSGARVIEHLPASRATRTEALRRVQRAGYVNGLLALDQHRRASVFLGAFARIAVGSISLLVRSDGHAANEARIRLHTGLGRARAALSRSLTYYGGDPLC